MIPEGMRDVLPPETGRLRAVEDRLRDRFVAYGYGEVRTPWLEFAETLQSADDDTLAAGYRLHDERGHELMVRTDMTEGMFPNPDDAPWTPPELAPRLVRVIASGRADALAGRYLHAEHDNVEALILRAREVVDKDLNAIRLQR